MLRATHPLLLCVRIRDANIFHASLLYCLTKVAEEYVAA